MKKIITIFLISFLAISASVYASARPDGRNTFYICTDQTGGVSYMDLDALDITGIGAPNTYDLVDGDGAMVQNKIDRLVYFYIFDGDGTNAESSPNYIRPDDYSTAGVWVLVTVYGGGRVAEGDSEVDVVDSGTGYAEVVIDGEQQEKISDGYSEHPTGFIYRVATTTDGNTLIFQVHDANGTAWRDALSFENGDSSDLSTTNWPRVRLGANVALTGLKNSAIGMSWGSEISSSPQTLSYNDMNKPYLVSAAATVVLPDVGTDTNDAKYGDWVQFEIMDDSETLTIDCDDADKIRRQGSAQSAGVTITTDGAGTIVTCIATTNADGSGTDGWTCRSNGTLAQGS